jgi:DNA-binding transcriptional MerR regulator
MIQYTEAMDELLAAFTPDQAERLSEVSQRRLAYWHKLGLVSPRYADDSRWLGYKRLYSFRDLVALRTLRSLRDDHHISMPELRKVDRCLRERYSEPWSSLRFWVLSGKVFFTEPVLNRVVSSKRPEQMALAYEMEPVAAELRRRVEAFQARSPRQIGQVERRRGEMGSALLIAGTRIPVAAIRRFSEAGYGIAEIMAEYPSLTEQDVTAALTAEADQNRHTA